MLLLAALLHAPCASAEGSVVSIKASILASSCNIATDSVEQTVDLGKGRIADLTHPGDATQWKAFAVNLTDCPVSAKGVEATLSGVPDTTVSDYYLNTGTAHHVAIEIMDSKGLVELGNGKTLTVSVDPLRKATFNLKGRMIATDAMPQAGTVTGMAELSFTLK